MEAGGNGLLLESNPGTYRTASRPLRGLYSWEMKHRSTQSLAGNAQSSFIWNSSQMETIHLSVSWWMNRAKGGGSTQWASSQCSRMDGSTTKALQKPGHGSCDAVYTNFRKGKTMYDRGGRVVTGDQGGLMWGATREPPGTTKIFLVLTVVLVPTADICLSRGSNCPRWVGEYCFSFNNY